MSSKALLYNVQWQARGYMVTQKIGGNSGNDSNRLTECLLEVQSWQSIK